MASSAPLPPDRILAYLYEHHQSYWKETRGIGFAKFGTALGVSSFPPHQYSRTLDATKSTPSGVSDQLRRQDVRQAISLLLGVGIEIFECSSEKEIDDVIARVLIEHFQPTDNEDFLVEVECGNVGQERYQLHSNEKHTLDKLASAITGEYHDILLWPVHHAIGPSFLIAALTRCWISRQQVKKAYLIRPYSRRSGFSLGPSTIEVKEKPFDVSLRNLAHRLGVSKTTGRIADDILRKVLEEGIVLFILNADTVSETEPRGYYSVIHDLIRSASGRRMKYGAAPVPIVLVGDTPFQPDRNSVRVAAGAAEQLPLKIGDRFAFFHAQWRRFCELRGNVISDDVGARLKRARWYYESVKDAEVFPIDMRLRAFFASNYSMHSYFDPTAGWSQLAGMPICKLPDDIKLCLEDVLYQLRDLPTGKRRAELRAARWCSTALYWLTEDAATELGRQVQVLDNDGHTMRTFLPQTGVSTFRTAVSHITEIIRNQSTKGLLEHPITQDSAHTKERRIYTANISVKSIIQEQWKVSDPFDRSIAHYRVAERLYRVRDDKDLLNVEFPLEPHWGRSRFHFLSETLRHLMRSCETSLEYGMPSSVTPFPREFPKFPRKEIGGSDAYEAVNFCFGELYWRQLNGNTRDPDTYNRKLARQHGAYQLTIELLQLMSRNNKLGDPHWALHEDHIPQYLREVGYAQLDLGDLSSAAENFRNLALIHTNKGNSLEAIDAKLDLVLALTTQARLEEAVSVLEGLESETQAISVDSNDIKAVDRRRILTLKRRVSTRRGHLFYLTGDTRAALSVYSTLPETSLVREVAHIYIATLGQIGDKDSLDLAMRICIKNIFQNTSRGVHHDALGFRIAMAHLFRKFEMLEVAETCLDQVHEDILRYGCSERTYLAFLLEAGRTVFAQGFRKPDRFARAYLGYLRPCLDRARSRGYVRYAETARRCAVETLTEILARCRSLEDKQLWPAELRAALASKGDISGLPASCMIDPLFSFDFRIGEDWALRLQDEKALEFELQELISS